MEGWGLQSVHDALSLLPLPPQTVFLLQCGILPTGYSPSQTDPEWVLPMGCSQEQTTLVWVPHGVTGSARKPASAWTLLHRLKFLPGGCSSICSPQATGSFGAHLPAPA